MLGAFYTNYREFSMNYEKRRVERIERNGERWTHLTQLIQLLVFSSWDDCNMSMSAEQR